MLSADFRAAPRNDENRRDGRVVEGARLESVYRGNSIEGSNPSLSASYQNLGHCLPSHWDCTQLSGSIAVIAQMAPEGTSATLPASRTPPAQRGEGVCVAHGPMVAKTGPLICLRLSSRAYGSGTSSRYPVQ